MRTKKKNWFSRNRRAEVGITASLILTSLLLVSGAAATTVITTNEEYQQQAEDTATEVIAQVSTGLEVVDIIGHYQNGAVRSVDLLVRLSYGSSVINLDFITIIAMTSNEIKTYTLNSSDAGTRFTAEQLNTASEIPLWQIDGVKLVGQGDLISITLTGLDVASSESAEIRLIPAHGYQNFVRFTVPDAVVGSLVALR